MLGIPTLPFIQQRKCWITMCSVFWQVSCSTSYDDLQPSDVKQCQSLRRGTIFPSRAPGSRKPSNSLHRQRKLSHRNRSLRVHLRRLACYPVAQHLPQVRLLFPALCRLSRIRMAQHLSQVRLLCLSFRSSEAYFQRCDYSFSHIALSFHLVALTLHCVALGFHHVALSFCRTTLIACT